MDRPPDGPATVPSPSPSPSPAPALPSRRRRRHRLPVLLLTALLILGVFVSGIGAGVVGDQLLLHPSNATASSSGQLPSVFGEVWSLIHDQYVDPSKINDTNMTTAAINGMLNTLGDQGHTRYLPAQQAAQQNESLSGSYVGVGIQVEQQDNKIVVVAPIDGSPAKAAGVKAGDVVVSVNGQSVAGKTLDQVVDLVRGPEGTTVEMVFDRPGQARPLDLKLRRTKLAVQSVTWAMLPGNVADMRLSQFAQGAATQLAAAIQQAQQAGAVGLVLDLRDDPGGLVDEAVSVASEFLPPETTVFISQVRDGTRTAHVTDANATRTSLPLVVLVDSGTASASEIVSGALQEQERAKVVGEKTYGTGTVLSQFGLSDGSALLLGTELWLTPGGHLIKGQGITPDYTIALPSSVKPFIPNGGGSVGADAIKSDAQLEGALDVLRGVPPGGSPTAVPGCLRCT